MPQWVKLHLHGGPHDGHTVRYPGFPAVLAMPTADVTVVPPVRYDDYRRRPAAHNPGGRHYDYIRPAPGA